VISAHRDTQNDVVVHPGSAPTTLEPAYHIEIRSERDDPEWDAFLEQTPNGHHMQTSMWGQTKVNLGWKALRVAVRQAGKIVGGAQLLLRSKYMLTMGYVPRGPLLISNDPLLLRLVMDQLHQLVKKHSIHYLVIQPPYNAHWLTGQLSAWGFRPGLLEYSPEANAIVDLQQSSEVILAKMHPKTRYNIRLAERKGVTVREGTEADIATFYRLYHMTSQRQQFVPFSEDYIVTMWQAFARHGAIKLFLAEYEGKVLSAFLDIAFSDTLLYKLGGWSGEHSNLHPNEALHWAIIKWAQERGYHHYDLEELHMEVGRAVLEGHPIPEQWKRSVYSFKLSFGSNVHMTPCSYEYIPQPLLRWGYSFFFPRLKELQKISRLVDYLRTNN
jgi:lipid II:glycine glycyltransferase (peptidoglycan interpeptide bridge formation enzyme)